MQKLSKILEKNTRIKRQSYQSRVPTRLSYYNLRSVKSILRTRKLMNSENFFKKRYKPMIGWRSLLMIRENKLLSKEH